MPDSDYERAVADCVVRSMSEVSSLVTMRESPDADLLLVNGSHVGLEIVGLIDPGPLAAKRLMESAREAIERELEARGICEYVEVIFELAEILAEINMGVGRDWLRNLPRLMAALLAECRDARIEKSTLEAYGVTGVAYVERKPHTRSVVGRGYRQWTNPEQTLAHATLKNKHEKLDQYRIKNGDYFQQYWLALASLGPGSADGGFLMLLDSGFQTTYDRVLLLMRGGDGRLASARDVTPRSR